MPILRTSVQRLNFRQRLEHLQVRHRATSSRLCSALGRSVAESSKKTTSPLPRAFAVIIAASAQATSSRSFAACPSPGRSRSRRILREVAGDRIPALFRAVREHDSCSSSLRGGSCGLLDGRCGRRHRLVRRSPARSASSATLCRRPLAEDVVHLLEVIDLEHDGATFSCSLAAGSARGGGAVE